ATRTIRKTNQDIPVIALTAYAFADDKENSIKAGCNAYLTKPVKIEQLSKILSSYLK
ncbi:MAG: response regulator, partial [Bacteroidales bacterium]|nr:response regulator [Bacteroidales bacterium]